MTALLFGTGGVPHSAKMRSTESGIERIAELGLGCMEMEFVRGAHMSEAHATVVAETAHRESIKLSAHAPYFINLNAHDPEKIKASRDRIIKTAHIASLCGTESIIVHAAFYLGDPPEKVYHAVKKQLVEILKQLREENNQTLIRLETMGKPSQFGTIEEILNLCSDLEGIAPCIDFAHWHARTGGFNSYSEFAAILQQLDKKLGRLALDNIHIHFSGIAYSVKGEKKHLNLKESDLEYITLLRALKDYGVKGTVICESPNLEEDAMLLQATYNSL
ncbi:MAG: TIM barrel protein [Dehalococcoidales bacterium]|nr:TIM barrel protein [Dehalococcoidales bacterium]